MVSRQNFRFTQECQRADHKTLKPGIKSDVEMPHGFLSMRASLKIIRL